MWLKKNNFYECIIGVGWIPTFLNISKIYLKVLFAVSLYKI